MAHDVVWCTRPLGAAEVGELISARLGSGHDALWFVNPDALASIPGVSRGGGGVDGGVDGRAGVAGGRRLTPLRARVRPDKAAHAFLALVPPPL